MNRTVENELHELKGVFPGLTRKDFYYLNNGNIAVQVKYSTTGQYAHGTITLMLHHVHGLLYRKFPVGHTMFMDGMSMAIPKSVICVHRKTGISRLLHMMQQL